MTEFQLKNYLKFMHMNLKESVFRMICKGEEYSYEFVVNDSEISIKSENMMLVVCDIDSIMFGESVFSVELIEIKKYQDGEMIEHQTLPKPEKVRLYFMLMSVMGKRAGFVLSDKDGNTYKGCYTAGRVLYIDEDAECVSFYITDLGSLKLDIVCVTEVPGYLSFKSFVAEAEKYAKCTNRAFRKYGKKEQAYA